MGCTPVVDFHQIKKVKSSKFNVDQLSQYHLCFLLGKQHFKFCIVDSKSNSCLLLEDYLLGSNDQPKEILDTLKVLFEGHHLLNAGFWKSVKLAFVSPKSVLVPVILFDKDAMGEYLSLNCQLEPNEDFYYYKHHNNKIVNVFAVDSRVVDWFRTLYPNLNLHLLHHGSALIEGLPRQEDITRLKGMSLFVNIDSVDILIHEYDQLLYYNQFPFNSADEFINYVMIAMNQLGLDPNMSKVQVWGNIDNQSEYFKNLYKFIRNVSFGKRPSMLKFTFEFDEIAEHQYFDLMGLYYCE